MLTLSQQLRIMAACMKLGPTLMVVLLLMASLMSIAAMSAEHAPFDHSLTAAHDPMSDHGEGDTGQDHMSHCLTYCTVMPLDHTSGLEHQAEPEITWEASQAVRSAVTEPPRRPPRLA